MSSPTKWSFRRHLANSRPAAQRHQGVDVFGAKSARNVDTTRDDGLHTAGGVGLGNKHDSRVAGKRRHGGKVASAKRMVLSAAEAAPITKIAIENAHSRRPKFSMIITLVGRD